MTDELHISDSDASDEWPNHSTEFLTPFAVLAAMLGIKPPTPEEARQAETARIEQAIRDDYWKRRGE